MKKNKLPSVIVLMILTLITVIFWVSFGVYRVFTKQPASVVSEEISAQIDPKIDTSTLESIKNRTYVE